MKKWIPYTFALSVLVLAGAGCSGPETQDAAQLNLPSDTSTASVQSGTSTADTFQTTSTAVDTSGSSSSTAPATNSGTSTSMGQTQPLAFPGILPSAEVNKKIRIKTTLGDIVIQLMADQGPRAASNFIYLVKQGFYDGTIFHRVIPGFMIQGGDPTGTGRGGPGYEFQNDPVKVPYTDGIVAMANAGPDTNGSQFFIMVANYPLPPDYSIFGKVVSGLDVAHKIAEVARDPDDRPLSDVKMLSVTVEK
ncbi:MAG TPA: peptidylprolyl isomerase [Patescibacteria group bacterium]|nr:peptidylprolyl isomerase [Patescibacteria group bacterium]